MQLFLIFCIFYSFSPHSRAESKRLVVYSERKEKFVRPLLDKFEQDTKIKVAFLSGVKVVKILEEQPRPLGNIFISNDVGQLEFLRLQQALQGVKMANNFGISHKIYGPRPFLDWTFRSLSHLDVQQKSDYQRTNAQNPLGIVSAQMAGTICHYPRGQWLP